jgi:hypothetical protein
VRVRAAAPRLVASVLLALGFIWILRRGGMPLVPDRQMFAHASWWVVPAALLAQALAAYYRTCRWIHLLRPIAPGLSESRVLGMGLVGFTAVVMAPLRAGEFVRPYLLSRDGEVSFTQGLGATAAERIMDGLVIAVTLALALGLATPLSPLPDRIGDLPLDVAFVPRAAYFMLGLFVAAFGTMVLIQRYRRAAHRAVRWVLGRWDGVASFVSSKIDRLVDGLEFLPSRRHFVPFLTLTAVYFAVLALGHWVMLVGCGISATLAETWVIVGVMSLGILVPAGPGFFGAYQFSIYCGLALFFHEDVVLSSGAVFVFVTYVSHILVTLLSCVVGLWLMARSRAQNGVAPGGLQSDSR